MKSRVRKKGKESDAQIVARSMHRMRNPIMKIANKRRYATKDFKKKFDCTYICVSNWALHAPRASTIRKVARKLRIDPTELMYQIMNWREEKWDRDPVAYVRKHIKEMD